MKIEIKKIKDLKEAKYNPRIITEKSLEGLKNSIKEFGCVEPIIWNEKTGNVVGGHQRLKVLKSEKVEETSVVVVSLPIEKEKALNIALNNKHIAGDWTIDLKDVLDEINNELPELYTDLNLDELYQDIGIIEEEEEQAKDQETDSDENWKEFVCGDIKGAIPDDVYELFVNEWERLKEILETDKVTVLLEAMVACSSTTPKESIK